MGSSFRPEAVDRSTLLELAQQAGLLTRPAQAYTTAQLQALVPKSLVIQQARSCLHGIPQSFQRSEQQLDLREATAPELSRMRSAARDIARKHGGTKTFLVARHPRTGGVFIRRKGCLTPQESKEIAYLLIKLGWESRSSETLSELTSPPSYFNELYRNNLPAPSWALMRMEPAAESWTDPPPHSFQSVITDETASACVHALNLSQSAHLDRLADVLERIFDCELPAEAYDLRVLIPLVCRLSAAIPHGGLTDVPNPRPTRRRRHRSVGRSTLETDSQSAGNRQLGL